MKNINVFNYEKRLILFVSDTNSYVEPSNRIISDCNLETRLINIDEFCNGNLNINFKQNDVIYFTCCNSLLVSKAITKIYCGKIINRNLLIRENILNKKNLQCYLQKVGILAPKIYEDIESVKFPVFCKQNVHQGITFKSYNRKSLLYFFERFDIKDFYFEEALIPDNLHKNVFKIYYVNGKIYSKRKQIKYSLKLKRLCMKISSLLDDLEIFSVDFIKTNKLYKVIDMNVCTSLFLCRNGRKEFIRYINNI